ncbi:MAG: hypothetical protein A2X47_09665 [Lentisphaerae bacterium GWF2_38_69]|nr:MAG: hypothetical protein A2X47_09665 [Lentisphaerae bacterium GWF2_38_69]
MGFSSAFIDTTSEINISWEPSVLISFTTHSILIGDSSIIGEEIFLAFPCKFNDFGRFNIERKVFYYPSRFLITNSGFIFITTTYFMIIGYTILIIV